MVRSPKIDEKRTHSNLQDIREGKEEKQFFAAEDNSGMMGTIDYPVTRESVEGKTLSWARIFVCFILEGRGPPVDQIEYTNS